MEQAGGSKDPPLRLPGRAASYFRCRLNTRPVGIPLHDPVNPEEVQRSVVVPGVTGPLTLALPVQRAPIPVKLGAEIVAVPENVVPLIVPEIVPFQSEDWFVQLPFTDDPA